MAIDYLSSFVNTNGVAFPGTLTINSTGPSTTDGTELIKLFGDDIWGWYQALLDYASLTPNGITEGPGLSQRIEALQKGFSIGPGIITNYPKVNDPTVNGDRALLLTGQGVLIATYPLLDAAVYVGDGNNAAQAAAGGKYYRSSDAGGAAPDIAGPFLQLPDLRGATFRGLDIAGNRDPDGPSRLLGDFQEDQFQGHHHEFGFVSEAGGGAFTNAGGGGPISGIVLNPITDGVNGTPRIGLETRAKNISTNYVIGF